MHANHEMTGQSPSDVVARAFVADLAEQALTHRAVRHPYLQALSTGEGIDTAWALADFARHYRGYSAHFPCFLTAVISKLERADHRAALLENLTEESGSYEDDDLAELAKHGIEPEWVVGIAHPVLFDRFTRALGVTPSETADADQTISWRETFLSVLHTGSAAQAVGALGLGTENIVSTIYRSFSDAVARLDEIAPRDTVFFPLHTLVDDHHQEALQAVAADFATTEEGRADLRRGMLKALQLRSAYWDWLHARAMNPANADEIV